MDSRRDNRLPIAVVLTLLAALAPALPAGAQQEGPPDGTKRLTTSTVYTTSESTVVEASSSTKEPGSSEGREEASDPKKGPGGSKNRSRGSKGSGGKPACRGERSTMGSVGPEAEGVREPYDVYCSGEYKGTVFALSEPDPKPKAPAPREAPQDVSERLREEFPLPTGTIRINPGLGLVGIESWFWLEGVNGEPSTQTTDAFGTPIQVESRVTSYHWSFGDGTTVQATSPGRPYPQRSEIHHIFQRASAQEDYVVEVRFGYAVRYSNDGVNWTELDDVNRTSSARYRVRESQAVISR